MIVIVKVALHAAVSTLTVYLDFESDPLHINDKVQDYPTTHAVQDYFTLGRVDPFLFTSVITAKALASAGYPVPVLGHVEDYEAKQLAINSIAQHMLTAIMAGMLKS